MAGLVPAIHVLVAQGWAKRSVPTSIVKPKKGGHGATAPLPTLQGYAPRSDEEPCAHHVGATSDTIGTFKT
jgi:hypothetical protein